MKRGAWIGASVVLAFFLIGVGWGLWSEKRRHLAGIQSTPLRILCHENWLPDSLLKSFSAKHSVAIQHWTYSNPNELLRQMANANGRVDVICTSSMLLQGLIQSRWIKKTNLTGLPNARHVSVDFLNLPFDEASEYSIPILWNLYGLFGKEPTKGASIKSSIQSKDISVWGDELNILNLLGKAGLRIEERLQDSENKNLEGDIRKFLQSSMQILDPSSKVIAAESITARSPVVQIPLAQVARLIGGQSPYHFWLPTDGGTLDIGLLAVGESSDRPDLAMKLIDHLLSTEAALAIHKNVGAGVVHSTLDSYESIAPMQKARALRGFPLTQYNFPNLSLDALPRFQKVFSERQSIN